MEINNRKMITFSKVKIKQVKQSRITTQNKMYILSRILVRRMHL